MTRKPIILSGIAVAVVLLGFVIVVVSERSPPEPTYQGIKLSKWMDGSYIRMGKSVADRVPSASVRDGAEGGGQAVWR